MSDKPVPRVSANIIFNRTWNSQPERGLAAHKRPNFFKWIWWIVRFLPFFQPLMCPNATQSHCPHLASSSSPLFFPQENPAFGCGLRTTLEWDVARVYRTLYGVWCPRCQMCASTNCKQERGALPSFLESVTKVYKRSKLLVMKHVIVQNNSYAIALFIVISLRSITRWQ